MAHHWRTKLYVCLCRNSAFCKDLKTLRFRCIKTGLLLQKLISPHCKLITCELKSVNNFQTISLKLNNYVSFFLDYIPNLYNVISAHYALRHIFFALTTFINQVNLQKIITVLKPEISKITAAQYIRAVASMDYQVSVTKIIF